MPDPADQPAASNDLEAQLNALMAQASAGPAGDAEPDAPAGDDGPTDPIADADAALDAFEDAFESVQDVVNDAVEPSAAPAAPPTSDPDPPSETQAASTAESDPDATAAAEAPETEAQREQRDDELAAQIQSLLDESAAEEAQAFVSPDELLDEDAQAPSDDPAPPAEAAADTATPTDSAPPAEDDAPLIEQIDDLLADHAEDVIAGEFEDVDTILGVPETAGENVADPTDDLDPGNVSEPAPEAAEAEDDDLDGAFESMSELLNPAEEPAPDEASAPEAVAEEDAVDDDDLDGMFMPPSAMTPPPENPEPAEEDVEGDFTSLDDMLNAPPPSPEDADGAPPPEAAESPEPTQTPASEEPSAAPAEASAGWRIGPTAFRAAAVLLLGVLLTGCALINQPLDRFSPDIKQTVGWVALAVAGPGLVLIGYGLFFN